MAGSVVAWLFPLTKLLPLILGGFLLACNGSLHHPTQLVADGATYNGAVSADGRVQYFLGVPFATPPVGALRWRAAQKLELSSDVRDASQFAPACMQGDYIVSWYQSVMRSFNADPSAFPVPIESEDCLYLNIWRPLNSGTEKLPIVVYIHGGSNKGGWAYEPNYHGEELARRGVIVISIAYRLNVFGLFAHPDQQAMNFGLIDQIAALQWIHKHLDIIGGEVGSITLMGESAGGNNIGFLLASPLADGLFNRVIIQSAGSALKGRTTRDDLLQRTELVAKELLSDTQSSLEDLRKLSAHSMLKMFPKYYEHPFYFDPVVDGEALLQLPRPAIETRVKAPIDILVGSNKHEWRSSLSDGDTLENKVGVHLSAALFDQLKNLQQEGENDGDFLDRVITAREYFCPSRWLAEKMKEKGGNAWFYYFTRQRSGDVAIKQGVYHGAELPYVFGTHDDWLPTSNLDVLVSETAMYYWANFIKSGNPNGSDLTVWSPFDSELPSTQVLDVNVRTMEHVSKPLCAIFSEG
jgi:para-nitrobenzyl esterase|tara:strand:- start:2364 stop:3932 length:1569 start_codon:yes stop_codon:yes gene_type:complete